MLRPLAPWFVALSLTAAADAQQVIAEATATRGPIVAGKDGLVLPAGEFSVAHLIEATARYLCRNYLYDEASIADLRGFVLQRAIALDACGAEEILYSLLTTRAHVVLPVDEHRGLFAIVPVGANAPPLPITSVPMRSRAEILQRPQLHELVTTTLDLPLGDAPRLAAALEAFFVLGDGMGPIRPRAAAAGPHTLFLFGFRDQLVDVVQLVRQLERQFEPTPAPNLLQRLDALEREVVALRAELLAARSAAGGR